MGNTQAVRRPLKIKSAFTCNNGPHELFDYDNHNQVETIMYPEGPGFLQRKSGELQFVVDEDQHWETLFHIEEGSNRLVKIADGRQSKEEGELLWMVLQPKHSFILNQGDSLKLGKMVVTIKQIMLAGSQNEVTLADAKMEIMSEAIQVQSLKSGTSRKTNMPQCKVCFGQLESEEDPLITPCNCSGSLQAVHLECLRGWLKNKIIRRVSDISYEFHWNKLKCEICGGQFKQTYQKNERIYQIAPTVDRPEPPYIVMEAHKIRNRTAEQQDSSVIYVTKLEQDLEIKIGRDSSQHIRINDISVSRNHCSVSLINDRVTITDNLSKFGTLLRFKDPTTISIDNISLQYGSTNVQVVRQSGMLGCCLQCIDGQQFQLSGQK